MNTLIDFLLSNVDWNFMQADNLNTTANYSLCYWVEFNWVDDLLLLLTPDWCFDEKLLLVFVRNWVLFGV